MGRNIAGWGSGLLAFALAVSACGGSSGPGDGVFEPCKGLPCIRLNLVQSNEEPTAISCYHPKSPPAPVSTRFDVDLAQGTADFECDNAAGTLHLRGRLTGFGRNDGESGTFGAGTTIVLSATGKPLEALGPEFAGAGADLMPAFEQGPWRWHISSGMLAGDDTLPFLLPLGAGLEDYTVGVDQMIRIPVRENGAYDAGMVPD